MRFFLTAVSLAALSTTVLACTVETKTTGPEPAADGGVVRSGDGGGVKTGSPVKTGGASKDAGAVTEDPAPAEGAPLTCKDAVACISDCPDGDDACAEACYASLPAGEMSALEELGTCINDSGCDTDECIADVCATPIAVCLGN